MKMSEDVMTARIRRALAAFISLIIPLASAPPPLWAAAPNLLTYQGRLKEGGQPVTAARQVEIRLCDAPTAGTCATTGVQQVSVANGLFRSTFTVPSSVNLATGLWYLELIVNGNTLSPREQLTASVYSVYASSAATLVANPNTYGAIISTNVDIRQSGVGGGLRVSYDADPTRYGAWQTGTTATVFDANNVDLRFRIAGTDAVLIDASRNVRIGGGLPAARLDVEGDAAFGTGAMKSTFTATGQLSVNPGSDIVLAGGGQVSGLPATPSGPTAAASKAYVDAQSTGASGWTDGGAVVRLSNQADSAVVQSTMAVEGNAFSVGGSTLVVAGGNVGIGTTAPRSMLQVGSVEAGSPSDGQIVIGRTDGGASHRKMRIGLDANYHLSIGDFGPRTGDTYNPHVTVNYSNGNVGLGTTAPAAKLHLSSGTVLVDGNAATGLQVFGSTFVVRSNGNVGLGEAAPEALLTLRRANADNAEILVDGTANQSNTWLTLKTNTNLAYPGIHLRDDQDTVQGLLAVERSGSPLIPGGSARNDLVLSSGLDTKLHLATRSGTTRYSRMTLAPQGEVGVGTTSPAARLHVSSGTGWGGDIVVVSTGTSNLVRLTGQGEVFANKFIGDGSSLTNVAGVATGSIDTAKLASDAVDSTKILSGAVGTSKIAAAAVSGEKLADGAVGTAKLAAAAVTAPKLADGAVETAKLAADSVTFAKLARNGCADGEVLQWSDALGRWRCSASAGVAAGSVDTSKLASDAVDSTKILNGAVGTLKLAANAVTSEKLLSDAAGLAKVTGGAAQVSGGKVGIGGAPALAKLELIEGSVGGVSTLLRLEAPSAVGNGTRIMFTGGGANLGSVSVVDDDGSSTSMRFVTFAGEGMRLKGTKLAVGGVVPDATATLLVAGQLKVTGGSPAAGRVLTGDAAGLASWADIVIDTDKIVAGAIQTSKLAADAVDSTKILNGAVTDSKIAGVSGSKVTGNITGSAGNVTGIVGVANGGTGADLSATGGPNRIAKQETAGGAFTVSPLVAADIPGLDAAKINSGALLSSRGGTGMSGAGGTANRVLRTTDGTGWSAGQVDLTTDVAGALPGANLAVGTVDSTKLAAGSVGTAKLADDAVDSTKILNGAVGPAKIASFAVDSWKIAVGAVQTEKLKDDAVTSAKLLSDAASLGKVSGGAMAISGGNVGIGPAGSESRLTVLTANGDTLHPAIFESTAGQSMIHARANETVDRQTGIGFASYSAGQGGTRSKGSIIMKPGGHLAFFTNNDGASGDLERLRVASGGNVGIGTATPAAKLDVAGRVKATDFEGSGALLTNVAPANFSVDSDKLATAAVKTEKLADGAVNTAKLAADAVDSTKILSGAVNSAKIADFAVDSWKIAVGAVQTSKLSVDAVTSAALLSDAGGLAKVTGGVGVVSGGRIGVGTAAPDKKLHVRADEGNCCETVDILKLERDSTFANPVNDYGAGLLFSGKKQGGPSNQDMARIATIWSDPANSTSYLSFQTRLSGGVLTQRMTVSSDGLVVSGLIHSTASGFKFPDGTTMASANIDSSRIGLAAIDTPKLAADSVTTPAILNGAITGPKLAADAVTTTKVADGAVTFAKWASNGCGLGKVPKWNGAAWICANDDDSGALFTAGSGLTLSSNQFSVTAGGIDSTKLAAGAVTTSAILDGAINSSKLATLGKITIADGAFNDPVIEWGTSNTGIFRTAGSPDLIGLTIAGSDVLHVLPDQTRFKRGTAANPGVVWIDGTTTGIFGPSTAEIGFAITGAEKMRITATDVVLPAGAVGTSEIADFAIDSSKVADGAIGSSKLAALSIDSSRIANFAIDSWKIAAGSIGSDKIVDGAVGTAELASASVDSTKIVNFAIDSSKIQAGAVGTDKLADGAVQSSKLANFAVDSWKIAAGAVGSDKIAAGAVDSARLADGAVATAKIASGAVDSSKLANFSVDSWKIAVGAVQTEKLANGAVTFPKIAANGCAANQIMKRDGTNTSWVCAADAGAGTGVTLAPGVADPDALAGASIWINDTGGGNLLELEQGAADRFVVNNAGFIITGSVDSAAIVSGAVNTSKLAADAVDSTKLADGAVNTAKLASAAVTNDKIAANAVTQSKLATDSVGVGEIRSGAVGASELIDGAVQSAKIALGAVDSDRIADGTIGTIKLAAGFQLDSSKIAATGCSGRQSLRRTNANDGWECFLQVPVGENVLYGTAGAAALIHLQQTTPGNGLLNLRHSGTGKSFVVDQNGMVTTESVGTAALAASAVDSTKLAANSVDSSKIALGAVDSARLASDFNSLARVSGGVLTIAAADTAKVGIGTVSPQSHLHIDNTLDATVDATNSLALLVRRNAITAGTGPGIGFSSDNTPSVGAKIVHVRTSSNSQGDLAFYTKTTTAGPLDEKMRIKDSGRVGIGTTNPGGKLEVSGTAGDVILPNGSIGNAEIADASIDSAKIAGGAVDSSKLANGAVGSGKIAAGAVTATELAAGAVDSSKLAGDSVWGAQIKAGSIDTTKLVAGFLIDTAKLGSDAVDSTKILNGAVNSAKLAVGVGILISETVYTAPGATTWTKPAGCGYVIVEVIGGGGGGAGAQGGGATSLAAGGGGGGGGFSRRRIACSSLAATETITVGLAGASGADSPATAGGAGGSSSFGAWLSGGGGGGGSLMTGGSAPASANGGATGVASSGDLNMNGQRGGNGVRFDQTFGVSGTGGSAPRGGTGAPAAASVALMAGLGGNNYGGGGGGGIHNGAAGGSVGGAGAQGVVIVQVYQ